MVAGADRWIVRCRVSGGPTGWREGMLKANGVVRLFDSQSEARTEASRLERLRNDIHATAFFEYWVDRWTDDQT